MCVLFTCQIAPELANTPASSSKHAAQATPKGLLRTLCAGDAENVNQPGFYVEPKYRKSKRLFLNSARKVSFVSFLNWLKLGDGVGRYIKELFNEYISIPTLYIMGGG